MKALILSHFNPDLSVEIENDASLQGARAVLEQRNQGRKYLVAYTSRALYKAEKRYVITELELLAVVYLIGKFAYYVAGNRPFKSVADHSVIGPLIRTESPTSRLAWWILRLIPYQFEAMYRAGKQNIMADWLSRFPLDMSEDLPAFSSIPLLFLPRLDVSMLQRTDAFCRPLIKVLKCPTDTEA